MNLSTNDDSKTIDVLGRDAELANNNYESSGHQHTHSLSVKREMNGYHDDDDDDDDDHPITKTAESRIEIPVMEKGPELAKEALNITQVCRLFALLVTKLFIRLINCFG
ncbi:unnamed protein product [Anisakis simplex]|uniref:Uncharacterized protein n=1 Tax=Anisakis simplex TaxID=6269 RepID=A0A0M3JB43_ANISI|nr:unnamed protein product [Anisakis simplex]